MTTKILLMGALICFTGQLAHSEQKSKVVIRDHLRSETKADLGEVSQWLAGNLKADSFEVTEIGRSILDYVPSFIVGDANLTYKYIKFKFTKSGQEYSADCPVLEDSVRQTLAYNGWDCKYSRGKEDLGQWAFRTPPHGFAFASLHTSNGVAQGQVEADMSGPKTVVNPAPPASPKSKTKARVLR